MPVIIEVLDVGQGDGILILFDPPGGSPKKVILIDLGTSSYSHPPSTPGGHGKRILKYVFQRVKKFKGVPDGTIPLIDLVVVTHSDRDHYSLMPNLIIGGPPGTKNSPNRMAVHHFFYGGVLANMKRLQTLFKSKEVTTHNLIMNHKAFKKYLPIGGKSTDFEPFSSYGDLNLYLLSSNIYYKNEETAQKEGKKNSHFANANSAVFQLVYKGNKVMLPGDSTSDVEKVFITQTEKNLALKHLIDLQHKGALKVAHHGSESSSKADWLMFYLKPGISIISSGITKDGLPRKDVVDRLNIATISPYADHTCVAYKKSEAKGVNDWQSYHSSRMLFSTMEQCAVPASAHQRPRPTERKCYRMTLPDDGGVITFEGFYFD